MLDLNWERWSTDGTASPQELRVLATTDPFDHCNFTVRADFPQADLDRWLTALFTMTYDNPAHREMMDLEGLRAWLPGRTSGYTDLTAAIEEQHFFAEAPAAGSAG